jgi:hypothetical protein
MTTNETTQTTQEQATETLTVVTRATSAEGIGQAYVRLYGERFSTGFGQTECGHDPVAVRHSDGHYTIWASTGRGAVILADRVTVVKGADDE